ncbi:S-adenosyl-L-methionine-dependentmethyltransferases superfamily protein [Striga asiatica]|uniref:S-adenosyl-L-methionine-dependentmethyltransferases superfamily protein n=1 Tax=Striga asiatica TaxID=4170 RepID=A0A5A7QBJ2_STRAF|nr:S-adenosyl-L-methionine-dependentmethyltransferases superfamily protein [Striga asiatica]
MPRLEREATQDEFLYDDRWIKEVDNLFIDLLAESHLAGEWRHVRPGWNVFTYFRGVLVADVGVNFTVSEFQKRFDFLHNWMLRKHGLRHCVQSNVLTAPVVVWDDIFELYVFSLSSLTNEPLINGSIGNNVCHSRSTQEREASSEGSVNTHTRVSIQRQGSHHCAFPDHHVSRPHIHTKDLSDPPN